MSQSQSLTDVDRLSVALLTLLRTSDTTKVSDNALLGSSSSVTDDGKTTCHHSPLSATMSLPLPTVGSSYTPHQRWSTVEPLATTPGPLSLGGRLDDHGARATTTMMTTTTTCPPRYKTELCRTFAEHGTCRYGDKCQFAHGRDDLRAVVRHPKYKTDLCRTYHSTGLCTYGPRCHFIHNEDETRSRPTTAKQREVELAARELELRLALMNFYQREKVASQSAPASYFHSVPNAAGPAIGVPQRHVTVDRRQSVSPTVSQSSVFTSPVVSGTLDSAGGSPSCSAADDESPPPLSPTLGIVDDHCSQLSAASNDRLVALIVLAARLRLLQATTITN